MMELGDKEEIIKMIREEISLTVEGDRLNYYDDRVDYTISLWVGDDLIDKIVLYGN